MHFNFYAVQVKRLQKLIPNKTIAWAGLDDDFVFIKVNGSDRVIPRNDLRKMLLLPMESMKS